MLTQEPELALNDCNENCGFFLLFLIFTPIAPAGVQIVLNASSSSITHKLSILHYGDVPEILES